MIMIMGGSSLICITDVTPESVGKIGHRDSTAFLEICPDPGRRMSSIDQSQSDILRALAIKAPTLKFRLALL